MFSGEKDDIKVILEHELFNPQGSAMPYKFDVLLAPYHRLGQHSFFSVSSRIDCWLPVCLVTAMSSTQLSHASFVLVTMQMQSQPCSARCTGRVWVRAQIVTVFDTRESGL